MLVSARTGSLVRRRVGRISSSWVNHTMTEQISSHHRIGRRRWTASKVKTTTPLKKVHPPEATHVPWKAFGVGTVAGMCGSLAGMGGGFIMIPLLTASSSTAGAARWMMGGIGLSQHMAHGTSLFAVASTGLAGSLGYGLRDVVQLDVAAALAACGMITAHLGAASISRFSPRTLQLSLGTLMLIVAPLVPAKSYFEQQHNNSTSFSKLETTTSNIQQEQIIPNETTNQQQQMMKLLSAGVIGLGSGFLAGLLGVGGGSLVVPALTLTTDMTHYQALGTSLCAMTLPAMVGVWTHYRRGNFAMRVAPTLALGSFLGAYVGGKLALQLPQDQLRWGFSGLMLFLGTKTLLRI